MTHSKSNLRPVNGVCRARLARAKSWQFLHSFSKYLCATFFFFLTQALTSVPVVNETDKPHTYPLDPSF